MVLTFTGPALMQLERKDDVILVLAEFTDEALGLTQLWRQDERKVRDRLQRVDCSEGEASHKETFEQVKGLLSVAYSLGLDL